MWRVSDVAARDGVSKPTVSNRVKRFVERHGLTVERDLQGRVVALNVAEYDSLRGKYDDPSKVQAPKARPELLTENESYDEAQRKKAWLDYETKRLQIAQTRGELVVARSAADGYDRAKLAIAAAINLFPEHVDELAAAVGREGARGLLTALKDLAAKAANAAADALEAEARTLRAGIVEGDEPAHIQ